MQTAPAPIALTMGDPAGIGPEIALKCWAHHRQSLCPGFVFFGSAELLEREANRLNCKIPIERIQDLSRARNIFPEALPVLDIPLHSPSLPGTPDSRNGTAVIAAIEQAHAAVTAGQASALVTNPIHKDSLYACGFAYPGHTEYLAALSSSEHPPVMMLASERLRVVPVTIHIPLREVPGKLSGAAILHAAEVTHQALLSDFSIKSPRLAVAGLNPHAGESGAMGTEEIETILPAVKTLRERGLCIEEPQAADSLFHEQARSTYDAVICMYHDQALIPIKTLDFDKAVNVTLGLSIVRTSPDHGTAFNIAGQGKANPTSLLAALAMATSMAYARSRSPMSPHHG
ncbi:MAG: 4-hydroxythreonine-4-phosphate dehydrogenase PdxA [Pseudomonadota bacterium]